LLKSDAQYRLLRQPTSIEGGRRMRASIGHFFSFGFGLAAAVTSLTVGEPWWLAVCAGLLIALVCEISCWVWRKINPAPRKRRAGGNSAQVRPRPQQARPVPLYAARVCDLRPTEYVRVSCQCGRAEVLTAKILLTSGVPADRKLTDLGRGMRCARCDKYGCALVSVTRGRSPVP